MIKKNWIVLMLVGVMENDSMTREVSYEEAKTFANQHLFCPYFECKLNLNANEINEQKTDDYNETMTYQFNKYDPLNIIWASIAQCLHKFN